MDNADVASREQAQELKAALSHKKPALGPIGICRNCNEPIKTGCFCDGDCREDHEKRERFKGAA